MDLDFLQYEIADVKAKLQRVVTEANERLSGNGFFEIGVTARAVDSKCGVLISHEFDVKIVVREKQDRR